MALFQLVQASAFVVDLGAHRLKAGLAHDVGPTTFLPALSKYRAEPDKLAQRLFDAYREFYAAYAPEPQPVFIAVDQDVRPAFLYRLADSLLSVFPGVVFHSAPACALYSTGRLTCLLVDAGHRALRLCSAVDGVLVDIRRENDFCGEAFDKELLKLISTRNASCNTSFSSSFDASSEASASLLDVIDAIKRDYLAASLAPERDALLACESGLYRTVFRLPCGGDVVLNAEKHGVFEALYARAGLPETVAQTLSTHFANGNGNAQTPVVLTGGLATLSNFGRRLCRDLKTTMTTMKTMKTTIYGAQDSANAVWQGGAAFVGVGILQDAMITRRALDEEGARLLARVVV